MFYSCISWYIISKLYHWKIFDLIILIIIDITSKVLFNSLVKPFYLSIGLGVKSCRKLVIHSEFYNECYKESKSKDYIFICYKFVWQFIVVNDFLDYNVYEIFYWMRFIGRNKLIIFDKIFYNNEDIVITNIIDKVFGFK